MNNELTLRDIADDLLILNKATIDTLFRLENCAECIALYVFYYKTAKWQKTNSIKANDIYVKKSLKWGIDKIKKTKSTLKEHGLINIIQRRKNGKIEGWYIEVSYLVTQKKMEDIKIKVETLDEKSEPINNTYNQQVENSTTTESNNTQNQQVENSTCGEQDTSALTYKDNTCFNNGINILEDNTKLLENRKEHTLKEDGVCSHPNVIDMDKIKREEKILKEQFNKLWDKYPKKIGKEQAFKAFSNHRLSGIFETDMEDGLDKYLKYIKENNIEDRYIKNGSTWFYNKGWEDVYPEKYMPEWMHDDYQYTNDVDDNEYKEFANEFEKMYYQ